MCDDNDSKIVLPPGVSRPEADVEISAAPDLTQDEIDEAFREDRAKYTIEFLAFVEKGIRAPFVGVASFWKGANFLEGTTDEGQYLCPKCHIPIHSDGFVHARRRGKLMRDGICHECGVTYAGDVLITSDMHRLSAVNWAKRLVYFYNKLEGDCDFSIEFVRRGLRGPYLAYVGKHQCGQLSYVRNRDEYVAAQVDREAVVYRRVDFIQDTLHMVDPVDKIKSLLLGG